MKVTSKVCVYSLTEMVRPCVASVASVASVMKDESSRLCNFSWSVKHQKCRRSERATREGARLQRTLHSAGAVEVSGRQCSAQREVCTQPFPHNAPKDAAPAFAGLLHIFLAALACHAMATTVTTIDNRINGGGWVGGCSVRLPSLRLTLPFVPSLLLLAGRGVHVVSAGLPF